MKRLVAAALLVFFSAALSYLSLGVTYGVMEDISAAAETLEGQLARGEPGALETLERLEKTWEKEHRILSLYVIHQHLEELERNMTLLGKYVRMGKYPMAEVLSAQIAASVRYLYRSESPEIYNIF